MRRFTALLLVAFACAGLAAAGGAGAATQSVTTTTTIKVSAGEFFFKFSKASLTKPGTVVFVVKNVGHLAHDLKIGGKKTALIQPGKSAKLTVSFKKKGRFTYLCTVPGHAAQGMQGTFVVK
ncbi:MAG TPA: plastocyanin/azurin family copper-binding protein [Gaiellaceae bacterium]